MSAARQEIPVIQGPEDVKFVKIVQGDVGTIPSKEDGHRSPNSGIPSGNEGNFPFQLARSFPIGVVIQRSGVNFAFKARLSVMLFWRVGRGKGGLLLASRKVWTSCPGGDRSRLRYVGWQAACQMPFEMGRSIFSAQRVPRASFKKNPSHRFRKRLGMTWRSQKSEGTVSARIRTSPV